MRTWIRTYVRTHICTYVRTYVHLPHVRTVRNYVYLRTYVHTHVRTQDVRERDDHAWTPLIHAVWCATFSWRALRAARSLAPLSDVTVKTRGKFPPGRTALHLACESSDSILGKDTVVRALLDAHAALEDKTPKGLTPLLCAAASGQTNICRMLLHRKADINAKNEKGKGALQLAAAASSHCADFLRTVPGASEVPVVREGRDRKDPGHSKGKLGRYAVRSLDNTTRFHAQHLRYSQTPIESSWQQLDH